MNHLDFGCPTVSNKLVAKLDKVCFLRKMQDFYANARQVVVGKVVRTSVDWIT